MIFILKIAAAIFLALLTWASCRYIFGDPWRDYYEAIKEGQHPKRPSFFKLF